MAENSVAGRENIGARPTRSTIHIRSNEVFIENETSSFKKVYFKWRSEGLHSALRFLSSLLASSDEEGYVSHIPMLVRF